jgi:synaptojanin
MQEIDPDVDIFLAVVTSAVSIGNVRPGSSEPEEVNRIQEVGFFGLNTSQYDDLGAADGALPSPVFLDSTSTADSIMKDSAYSMSQPQPSIYEHPAAAIMNLFTSGTFYYTPSPVWDLSSRLSERIKKKTEVGDVFASFDRRFVWNEFVVKSLLDFRGRLDQTERDELDQCQFIVSYWSFLWNGQ